MMKNLSKSPSLRTLGNKSDSVYWSKSSKNNPNYSTIKDKQNQQSFEKSFHLQTAKSKNSKNQQNTMNRVTSLSNFSENQSVSRKPLDELLKSSKQSSFHGMKKTQMSQIKYETNQNENARDLASADKTICEINNDIEQEGRRVKTLQNEIHNSKSRSRSIKRKGLECTLYEKSLEKKIQGSGIKSNIKLTTVKKKLQKSQIQSENSNQVFKKDPKKVVLRKKVKENEGFTQLESFNSINLNSTINKKCDESFQTIKITLKSLSKVEENIRSLSKHKRTALKELNRSMSAIKQACSSYKFDSAKKNIIQNKSKHRPPTQQRCRSNSKNSLYHYNLSTSSHIFPTNSRLDSTLFKIHQKYKFITNYLSDVDIIGKLNSYDIAGKQQCKWVLLLIDEVYEIIKHSREKKLKGIDYTREYQYCGLHKNGEGDD